eukprot:355223-Pelagomonas_calceolata.AAC.1
MSPAVRGDSSSGRARALHVRGGGFESSSLHFFLMPTPLDLQNWYSASFAVFKRVPGGGFESSSLHYSQIAGITCCVQAVGIASGQVEVSLCLPGKLPGGIYIGRVLNRIILFVQCSGTHRFCGARRPALPMSMETRPAPEDFCTPLTRHLLAILWHPFTTFEMMDVYILKECEEMKAFASQKSRALRKGSLISKLARVLPKGPQA